MPIKKLPEGIQKAVNNCPLIVGIGPTAWPRIIPSYYFPKYKIICYNDVQDNEFIAKGGVQIFSIKKEYPDIEVSPETPAQIISCPPVEKYLSSLKEPFALLIYKSSSALEKITKQKGWKFIGNTRDLREKYENKKIFKETIKEVGLKAIPGDNILIDDLTADKLQEFQKKLKTKRLVLQLAEMTYGGGSGTLFVNDPKDLEMLKKRVEDIRQELKGKKKKIETVNIAPFIIGTTASIACCATKYGILTGPIQTQIVDMEEVGTKIRNRSGNYAGHDWCFRNYSDDSQNQAEYIAQRFGDYIYKQGYRGIFGLDLIVEEGGKVWPLECNPRDTDAFPVISMQQMETGVPPMDVFHNLEFLGVDYDFNFEQVNKEYKKKYKVSQIILHNRLGVDAVARNTIKGGVYEFKERKLSYIRPGFLLSDLKNENELLFVEGVSKTKQRFHPPTGRVFRMLRRGPLLKDEHTLVDDAKAVIEEVYKKLQLTPVDFGQHTLEGGATALFSDKLVNASQDANLESSDVVNVYSFLTSGFRRPHKIAWRKSIDDRPISEQIRSVKSQKHIKYDLEKIKSLGIEIKEVEEISQDLYDEWLKLYEKIISSKEGGKPVIGADWLVKKQKEDKKVAGIFAYKENVLIGGDLVFEVNGRLGAGYGIAERQNSLRGGLGLLLDYFFLVRAQKKGFKEVSFGQDTNLYGADLSTGLFQYKSKLGFTPYPANKAYWTTTYFRNFERFSDLIIFLTGEASLTLNVIHKDPGFDKSQILVPEGIKNVKFYLGSDILEAHWKLLKTKDGKTRESE